MFEIPDDDDLFSEDNLKEADESKGEEKSIRDEITNSHSDVNYVTSMRPVTKPSCFTDQALRSPQNKRSRILAGVNLQQTDDVIRGHHVTDYHEGMNTGRASVLSGVSISLVKAAVLPTVSSPMSVSDPGVRRRSLRKFPGPAGILPPANPAEVSSMIPPGVLVADNSRNVQEVNEEVVSSQASIEPFGGGAWHTLVSDLEPGAEEVLKKFSVQAMLHKAGRRQLPKGKVPLLLGILDSIDFHALDASVVVRDRTGQMQGTLHREVLKDFSAELQVGAAVVLRQVSVISPSPRTHYLNITAGNVVAIYPASGHGTSYSAVSLSSPTVPLSSPPEAEQNCSSRVFGTRPCREAISNFVQAAEIELLQAANATKESAVSRLRDTHSLATPRTQSPAICGRGGIVRQQTSPGLFAGYTVPGLNSAAASQRSLPHPCATTQTAGEKKFTFKNSGQQTLNPGLQSPSLGPRHAHSGTHISGLRTPVPDAKSSHPGAINSYPFTGMKTVGINSEPLNDNSLTSKTFPPLDPVMKSCDSHTVNTKIQPTPSVASGTSQTRSLDFSVLSSNNKSRDPLITNMPAPNSDSGTGSSKIVHGGLGQQNHATNAGAVMTAGAVTTKLDACFSQALVDSSSQQSTSSFKRMPPASRIQAQEQSSVDHISVAKNHAVHSAAGTKGGLNQASAPCNMWDEELSDDILSQLSDDF